MLRKLVLALLIVLPPAPAGASNLPDYPFIHAAGEGLVRVMPDLGEIDFDISAQDADSAAALAQVEARVADVRALLDKQGAGSTADAGVDFSVRDIRKEARKPAASDTKDAKDAPPGYDIRCSVHINVRDLGKWRPIMQALLLKSNIDRLSTSFGLRDREKIRAEVTAEAIHDAQRKAEAMAVAFGKHAGPVAAVSAGLLRNLTTAIGLAPLDSYRPAGNRNSGEKEFLAIELLTFSQSVDMIFRIK